jgi:signal transduction histidine kinase
MKLSFERIFIGFFTVIIVAVIALGAINYHNNKSYYESARWVAHTNEVLKESAQTLSTLQDMGIRSYITTGDSTMLESYLNANKNIVAQIDSLKESTKDNREQQRMVDSLDKFVGQRIAITKNYLALYNEKKIDSQALSAFTLESRANMNDIRKITSEINNREEALLKSRKEKAEKDKQDFDLSISLVFALIALLLAACLAAIIYYFNTRKKFEKNILALNQALESNVKELHDANKELESFSYSVSHDLRAPLRIIDGFAKIITEEYADKLDEEGKRFTEAIRSNAQRMGMLIDDLLNFSRISRQELALREVNMNNTVDYVLESFKALDRHLPADIEVQPLPSCKCDEHLLHQVWVNLISNSIKYSRKNEKPSIIIGTQETPTEHVYYVRDNGVGFDMEFAGKLFGVFQRLHKASDYEGTGVGLALASRIITRHKGRIWAEAKTNEGATFYFSIPK